MEHQSEHAPSVDVRQLKASPLEPQIVEYIDVVTGDPVIGIRIRQFISRDPELYEDHVMAALAKLDERAREIVHKIQLQRVRRG
jgi:hypothetical protein